MDSPTLNELLELCHVAPPFKKEMDEREIEWVEEETLWNFRCSPTLFLWSLYTWCEMHRSNPHNKRVAFSEWMECFFHQKYNYSNCADCRWRKSYGWISFDRVKRIMNLVSKFIGACSNVAFDSMMNKGGFSHSRIADCIENCQTRNN